MNKSSMNNPSSNDQDGKIVDQAKQAVTNVASSIAHQAQDQVNAGFDTRKDKAVETIGNVASAIRETSDKLKGVGPLGDVAGRAADGIEQVADFFEGKQIGDIVRDVERFARREPALFVGAAFALGLIGGRFLKSSAHRTSGSSSVGQYARQGGGGYDRYEQTYGASSFGDDDYLSDADLEDAIDSRRMGSYGTNRGARTTQPLGSRSGSAPQAASAGSSFGTASKDTSSSATTSPSTTSPSTTSAATTKSASAPPMPLTSSTSSSTSSTSSTSGSSTPKNGLGGGNMGSV